MAGTIAKLLATLPVESCSCHHSTDAQLAAVETLLKERGCLTATNTEKALVANRLRMYDAADIWMRRTTKSKGNPA